MANIVIVGTNQGIGYHMAKRLLELNHSVVVLDIDISNIRQLQPRYPETLLPIVVDARRLSDIENGVKQAAGRFGSIDIAIHNACRCTFMSEPDSDYDVYRDVMDVNFFGALRLAKTVLPYMASRRRGASYLQAPASALRDLKISRLMRRQKGRLNHWQSVWKSRMRSMEFPFTYSILR